MTTISATASSGTDVGGRPLSPKSRVKATAKDLIARIGGNVSASAAERIMQLAELTVAISDRAAALNPTTPVEHIVELLRLVELVETSMERLVATNTVTTINTGTVDQAAA
jgi:hypothetical protein